jgi:large subunit ribosomal protein L24
MKTQFSPTWVSSTQPRKQRKYRYEAPAHRRHSFLNAHLSKDLRKKHGFRSVPVRKGDEVSVMRGNFAGQKGKILSVDYTNAHVVVENITRKKADGSKVAVRLDPSNLLLLSLTLEDTKRLGQKTNNQPVKETPHASNKK